MTALKQGIANKDQILADGNYTMQVLINNMHTMMQLTTHNN